MGENAANFMHKITVKILTVDSSSVVSAVASIHAPFILSVHLSDDEHQEILEEVRSTNYGEKIPVKITAKIPDKVTLTLCNAKFLEETLVILVGEITW